MAKGFFCAERNTIFHYGVNPVPRFSSVAFGHCAAGFLSIQYVFTPLQEGYMDELWSACKPQDNLVTGFTVPGMFQKKHATPGVACALRFS